MKPVLTLLLTCLPALAYAQTLTTPGILTTHMVPGNSISIMTLADDGYAVHSSGGVDPRCHPRAQPTEPPGVAGLPLPSTDEMVLAVCRTAECGAAIHSLGVPSTVLSTPRLPAWFPIEDPPAGDAP